MLKKARACAALRKSISMFRGTVELALQVLPNKEGRKKRHRHQIEPGSLADDKARLAAGNILIDELVKHHKRSKGTDARTFLITLCWDAGLLPYGATHLSELEAMKAKAYRLVRNLKLNGLGVLEVAPLRKTKWNPALSVAHFHIVVWTYDAGFKPKALAAAINAHSRFPNRLGAPGVTIQSRRMAAKNFKDKDSEIYKHLFAKLEKDQTKASLAWLGYYLFKAPAYVMQLCPKKRAPGEFVMRSNSANYSAKQAFALERLLNEIPIINAVFAVGEGKLIGRSWRAKFNEELQTLTSRSHSAQVRKIRSKSVGCPRRSH